MISKAGESFPYFFQDKNMVEKIKFKHFSPAWIHPAPPVQSHVWSWPEGKLDCTAKLLGHELCFHNSQYLHKKKTIKSEELEMHVAWKISDYSTYPQTLKTNTALNDPNPLGTYHFLWWLS